MHAEVCGAFRERQTTGRKLTGFDELVVTQSPRDMSSRNLLSMEAVNDLGSMNAISDGEHIN